jgi:hypothetical protein
MGKAFTCLHLALYLERGIEGIVDVTPRHLNELGPLDQRSAYGCFKVLKHL